MIVEVVSKDCYRVSFLSRRAFFVRRQFMPELFLAITVAVIEKYGFQSEAV